MVGFGFVLRFLVCFIALVLGLTGFARLRGLCLGLVSADSVLRGLPWGCIVWFRFAGLEFCGLGL